jgi:cytochrome c peroxidase
LGGLKCGIEGVTVLNKVVPLLLCFVLVIVAFQLFIVHETPAEKNLMPLELLGKQFFFDTNLSTPIGQSCAACHDPEVGFGGPDSDINAHGAVYEGAVDTRFGNRHPPTAAYGGDSPVLYYNETSGLWIGGMFFDGHATGWTLGDPLAEQAQAPFLNPLEMNNPNPEDVVKKVTLSNYADLFEEVWGDGSLNDVEDAYDKIAISIAAYERSSEVSPFTSKYDAYLAGKTELTEMEALGLELYEGKAACDSCHISQPGPSGEPPLFTDFTYRNLGIPKNPENPFYSMPSEWNPDGEDFIDYGLGGFLKNASYPPEVYEPQLGNHKVPTLRNVDLRPNPQFVKSYGHNGFFKSLEDIVHFYNTRDVEDWPEPEVPVNVDVMFLGNLELTSDEEAAVVAFLKTLNDGYTTESSASIVPVVLIGILVVILACLIAFVVWKRYKSAQSAGAS